VVKNNGNLYVCTIPSWCSGAAIFYEPGAGSAWQQAWTLMGACPSSRPLSILQPSATSHLLIYPNPTQDILQIFLQEEHDIAYLRVEISNLNGQSVYSQTTYNEPFTLHRTIDMSAFVSGLYIIKVVTPNWESVEKVEKF
jgi:hypothetical protein